VKVEIPTLDTPRLRLRAIHGDDLDAFAQLPGTPVQVHVHVDDAAR
jgi:hypothetical protein